MKLNQRQIDALGHIVDHCQKVSTLTKRIGTQANLETDWEVQYALIRCVEVIGEASTRLGPQFHGEHPEVPWRLVTGMRNRLIHGYDEVSVGLLWGTALADVPALLSSIEAILHDAPPTVVDVDESGAPRPE